MNTADLEVDLVPFKIHSFRYLQSLPKHGQDQSTVSVLMTTTSTNTPLVYVEK